MNNFHSAMIIITGLQNAAVSRYVLHLCVCLQRTCSESLRSLKRNWDDLSSRVKAAWEELNNLMSMMGNYKLYITLCLSQFRL
jgi:hypothetical protein